MHTPLVSHGRALALHVCYGPDDDAYVLAGVVDGTARTADILAALTWTAAETTGYDLAYRGLPPPRLWAWVTPISERKHAIFAVLAPALEFVARYGGQLLAFEVPNPARPGARNFHVVHPSKLAIWTDLHLYVCGTLTGYGPCAFFIDMDGGLGEAPELACRAFAEAEAQRVVDEAVAMFADFGVAVARDDFRLDETPRRSKFSVHMLSDGFHLESDWLARALAKLLHARLLARDDVYHFLFRPASGEPVARILVDPAAMSAHQNLRYGGKRTAGDEAHLTPVPWPRAVARDVPPDEQRFRGIPQRVMGRRIGYADFNDAGQTYLRDLCVRRPPRQHSARVRAEVLAKADVPQWFADRVEPLIEAQGFATQVARETCGDRCTVCRAAAHGDTVHMSVTGERPGATNVQCPVCGRPHRNGYSSVWAVFCEHGAHWHCSKYHHKKQCLYAGRSNDADKK